MTRKDTRAINTLRVIVQLFGVLIVLSGLNALGQTSARAPFVSQTRSSFPEGITRKGERLPMNQAWRRALDGRPSSSGPLLFMPVVDYGSGGFGATSVAVADVNGDGKPDLIVTNACADGCYSHRGSVGVMLGNGDGTFGTVVTYDSGGDFAYSVAVADVNRDGKPDLIVANGSIVGVLIGNGDGTFQSAATYNSGSSGSVSVAVADLNGDSKLDIVVANPGTNNGDGSVSVLLGNGDGTFRSAVTYGSGAEDPHSVAIADVNRDGKPDLLLGSTCRLPPYICEDLLGVLLGDGDGTFKPVVTYSSGEGYQSSVTTADVNGDGKLDVLTANLDSGTVGVLLGNGNGTFQPVVTYDAGGGYAISIAAGDVNGDGKSDLVVGTSAGVAVLLGNGDGTFQLLVDYPSGGSIPDSYPDSVALADVNGDAKPDVLVANYDNSVVGVLLNNSGAPPTTTSLVSSMNPATVKQVVTYTATVTPQSGGTVKVTVMFRDEIYTIATITVAGNEAAYSTSYKTISAHPITATYSGDLHNAAGSISNTLTEHVRGTSKTVVTTSESPSLVGQPVTFTAAVTSKYGPIPDGELVTFYDGTTTLASVALGGEWQRTQLQHCRGRLTRSRRPIPGMRHLRPVLGPLGK